MILDASHRSIRMPITRLAPFYSQMVADPQGTCRALSRSAALRQQNEFARLDAARGYSCPSPLSDLYQQLIDAAELFLVDAPALQQLFGRPVPLVTDHGLSRRLLRNPLSTVFSDTCFRLGFDPLPILEAWQDSGSDGGSFVGFERGRCALYSPNRNDLAGLIRLAHEAGHWLYETNAQVGPWESIARYVESEAYATWFGRVMIQEAVNQNAVTSADRDEILALWASYVEAEDHLNFVFFLEEAKLLGLPVPKTQPLSYVHLRETRTMFFGYQVVYAAASLLTRTGAVETFGTSVFGAKERQRLADRNCDERGSGS